MRRIIHWFRRDLRITDNTSLFHACNDGDEVIPVYILSEWKKFHTWSGANRQEFLCQSLASLNDDLQSQGAKLIIRTGEPIEVLQTLAREAAADAIYFNRNYDPYSAIIEEKLATAAQKEGTTLKSFKDVTMFEPGEVLSQAGTPFRVFTPYARAWHAQEKPALLPSLKQFRATEAITSLPLPTLKHWDLKRDAIVLEAGEKAAWKRLTQFLTERIKNYSADRNLPGTGASSRLSQDLRFGILSPRQIYFAALEASHGVPARERKSINSFVNEIVWREFYFQILANFPKVLESDFSDQFAGLKWDQNPEALLRWEHGETGFPIVDAGMRELNATGFMHNRLRMIVAMFLTKDLHLHWQEGEKYFMQKLVDGEIASNNGGWQWSAGTGADAAPYFRIQNPWLQTENHDPDGIYIKKWIPELRDVAPALLQKESGGSLAKGYPAPMVDHARERQETLLRFKEAIRGK